MKRIFSVLALVLCLSLLAAGCSVIDEMDGIRRQLAGSDAGGAATPDPEDPMTATFPPETQAPAGEATPEPEPDVLPEPLPDGAALTVADCVEDAQSGAVPRIILDCPGAEQINAAIDEKFASSWDDPMFQLHYEAALGFGGRVLSVLMVLGGPNDWTEYTPYVLDLTTGQALTGPELLALLGQDPEALKALESTLLGQEFDRQFSQAEAVTDAAFYDQQYQRTVSPDNAQTDRLWLDAGGQLCFAGRIFGLAGAEYYEYPLGTGLVF